MRHLVLLFCPPPRSCWKRPFYGEVILIILSPVLPIEVVLKLSKKLLPVVVVPEGVVVVMGPTVSYITGRKENMYSNIP